jgi:hypothetical protein
MARVSDNATAPFVVFGWDGEVAGVVSAWDNEKEAADDAAARKAIAPENVDYYSGDQEAMRQKVAELTGTPVEQLADLSSTLPKAVQEPAPSKSDKGE